MNLQGEDLIEILAKVKNETYQEITMTRDHVDSRCLEYITDFIDRIEFHIQKKVNEFDLAEKQLQQDLDDIVAEGAFDPD